MIALLQGQMSQMAGVQFSIRFDANSLEFAGLEPLLPGLSPGNFGTHRISEGLIAVSFENRDLITKEKGTSASAVSLFRIVFRAKTSGTLSHALEMVEHPTPALAFGPDGKTWKPVMLPLPSGAVAAGIQAWPNPFGASGIWLRKKNEVTTGSHHLILPESVQIFDNQGRFIFQTQLPESGALFLPASIFPIAGTYYCQLGGIGGPVEKLVFVP